MRNVNSQNTLQQIAKQMRARVSNCKHYDPNVCSYEPDPDNVADIITKAGQPFLRRATFTKDQQKIRLYANDDFLQITLPFETGLDPMSLNRKDEIYFFKPAGAVQVGTQSYQIFSRKGVLNEKQKALVHDPAFKTLVDNMRPIADESLHFYGNGLSIYLFRPTADRAVRILDEAGKLLSQMSSSPARVDFSDLPPQFSSLLPLLRSWGITDDAEREERREATPRLALQAIVEEVRPHLRAIDSYLDSFGRQPLSESAVALGALAEFVVETELYLKDTRPKD